VSQQFIWKNGQMLPFHEATTHVLTHGLHYGSAVFEGVRFYKTAKGPAIFKLKEHIDRLFYSARALGMQIPFSHPVLMDACIEVVFKNELEEGYIRPLAYYGHGPLRVMPAPEIPVDVAIACWAWGAYLAAEMIDMQVSQYIRVHPKSSTVDAKIAGHYVNSLLASLAIKGTHYHDALLLDAHGYVAEGSANNIFIVKEGKLKTPPLGTILAGITRQTIIELAHEQGLDVSEEKITVEDVLAAQEVFVCGTAAEVTGVRSLNDQIIGSGEMGPVTEAMRSLYIQAVRGDLKSFESSLARVWK
jgi:branched-chain amino acid aminotransferase